ALSAREPERRADDRSPEKKRLDDDDGACFIDRGQGAHHAAEKKDVRRLRLMLERPGRGLRDRAKDAQARLRPFEVGRAVGPEDDGRRDRGPKIEGEAERPEEDEEKALSPHASAATRVSGSPPNAPEDIRMRTSPGRTFSRRKRGISS